MNPLRVPERLFRLAMWTVSFVFAGFLIGLGGKIVGDLPGVEQRVYLEQFIDAGAATRLRARQDSLNTLHRSRSAERERAVLAVQTADNAYASARESFSNWIATRTATTDPQQDPEVIQRTRALDDLNAASRAAEEELGRIDVQLLALRQASSLAEVEELDLREAARVTYERALFWHELRIFTLRLALTLPLLLLAGWMIARKRRSDYWPLYRGFVIFAVFAFFVELVPYLPSYGGYVRYGVGIIASAVVGHFVIRAMRRYLARRQEAAMQTEAQRRSRLGYEEAIKRIGTGVCPGCERAVAGGANTTSNFCVHCGMMLFNQCTSCETRKNAFFQYCPNCGVQAGEATDVTAPPAPAALV